MANEIEIMRVLRIPPLGKLVVQVGETQHGQIAEIAGGKSRQMLLAAIGELVAFAGGYQTLVDAGFAPPIGLPVPSQPPQKMQQEAFLQKLEQERDKLRSSADSKKSTLPRAIPILNEAPVKTDGIDRTLPIVAQIDAILQQFVAADAELSGRSIHLTEHPDGGLQIKVDGELFSHPNKLGEPKIQKMIKRALREWEKL
ncbi:MAG: hypothetical protein ACE5EY_13200 [Anaerolineae bacterium]